MNQPNVSPWRTLGLIAGIAGLISAGILGNINGTGIGGYELKFPIWEDFLEGERTVNMDALLENYHQGATTNPKAATPAERKNPFAEEKVTVPPRHLQLPRGENPLEIWFRKLDREAAQRVVRVLHYGDSQIEGDRISAQIRQQLQVRFGGVGPGLISITPQVPAFSVDVSPQEGLSRHVGFTPVADSLIEHGNFGPRFTVTRCDTSVGPCNVRIAPRSFGYTRARTFENLRVFWQLRASNRIVPPPVRANDSILLAASITGPYGMYMTLPAETEYLDMDLSAFPGDILAVSLEGKRGIVLDNIALRGSAGLIFTKADSGSIEHYIEPEEVGLILLQFGGNVIPYLKDTLQIERYTRSLSKQISDMKRRFPAAAIIFIGPSDMATKQRTKMVTYPLLDPLRRSLRAMALNSGCAYWDTYEAMGGHNSMSAWVTHDPPYASTDYVHFTPKGARLVGDWITEAITDAYEEWKAYKKAME